MDEIRMLQSSAMGYGNVSVAEIDKGLELRPHIIVGQGTSSDPGPGYLSQDNIYGYSGRINKKRDLGLIIAAAHKNKIPFIFSGGSPSGSNVQLEGVLRIVNEISKENGYKLRVAVIRGEIDKKYLINKIKTGSQAKRLVETERLPKTLTIDEIEGSKRIVAQMGPEPIMKALALEVDGVIAGRSLDIGLHMAYPLLHGFDKAVAAHAAKTIECGALCCDPPINGNVFAIIKKDHFLVFPLIKDRRCTIRSIAAHAFYERPDITKELNPGGFLDISDAQLEQYDENTVRVSGARWTTQPYTIKVEGVKPMGFRTITVVGIRDPNLINYINPFLEDIKDKAYEKFASEKPFQVNFRIYGKNAVLGIAEPNKRTTSYEICVIPDIIATTQEKATTICSYIRGRMFFSEYPDRTSTSGNVAIPFSPNDIEMGEAYVWNIWHALELDDPCEPFPMKIIEFPNTNKSQWED